jgi:NAD(P)-dependent dehydrogenase (short-subunit alcohol dehydrogenase family)
VSVSSRAGVMGFGDYAAYSVAKGAIITLTKALAEELLPHNITVNAIAPSTIDTEANRQAMANADWSRWVKPEEIAKVLTFLCSDDAQVISGALIPVYGRA